MLSLDRNRFILFAALCLLIICAAEATTIITSVSPTDARLAQRVILFISLWVLSTGFFILPCSTLKRLFWPSRKPQILVTVRQAALFSLLPIGALFLSSLQLLRVWEALPLIASLFLLELFFEAETPI